MQALAFTTQSSANGITEREFTVGEIPGVLWSTAAASPSSLVLMGHGADQHKKTPALVARAHQLATTLGCAVVAIDAPGHGDRPRTEEDEQARAELQHAYATDGPIAPTVGWYGPALARRAVPEWQQTIDALLRLPEFGSDTPIGYGGGITLGTGIGVPLTAVEPRIRAAVFGGGFIANEALLAAAAKITVPVLFLLQWDEEHVERDVALALFGAFASRQKTLHANPGGHGDVPDFELNHSAEFLRRHLDG